MKRVLQMWLLALAVLVGVSADARPAAQEGSPRSHGEMSSRLSRHGSFGRIHVQGGRKHFPDGAEVSIERKRPDDVKRKIHQGWSKRKRSGKSAASPSILASYDISIRHGGRKWQPDAGDPVRVDVELDAPVAVTDASSLGVVHLADDGTVEKLDASRYGFTYNKEKTAVTAFWFSAEGFSVYAITEGAVHTTDSDPARRLYDFYSLDFNKFLEDGVTSNTTYNTYVPRYFKTLEGNYTFRQIVTNNQFLVRPEALPSPLGRTFMGWYLYSTNNANKTVNGVTYDADGYATTPFDFEAPVVFNDGETGEHEYVLRSQFDRVGYVIFHEQPVSGVWPITAVRRGIMTEIEPGVMQTSVDISDLKVTYDDTQDENASHENTAPRMIFRGWSEAQVMPGEDTDVTGGVIRILSSPYTFRRTKDTAATPRHLFPVFVNINWLYFQTAPAGQGASYIPSRYYYADEGTNRFPVPLRTGYTFNGWWTGPDTNTAQRVSNNDGTLYMSANLSGWDGYIKDGNLMLNENVTVYGAWTPAPTKYTVVIWQQKATDAANLAEADRSYDFVASYTNYAMSATSVSVPATYKGWGGQKKSDDEDYTGFHFDRCDGETVIDGDGTTVLNVYYDRDVYTMAFFSTASTVKIYYSGNNSAELGSRVTSTSTINTLEGLGSSNKKTISGYQVAKSGSSYYIRIGTSWYSISNKGSNVYSASSIRMDDLVHYVTALAGSSVKDVFPIEGYDGKTWKGDTFYTQRLASFELMPNTDIKFTPGESQSKRGVLYYWVEVDSSYDGEKTTHDGKYYTLYKTINHDYNFLTKKEDFHDLAGYVQSSTDVTWNSSGQTSTLSNNNVHNFYYDRVGYTIEFKDSYTQNVLKDVGVKYSEGIAGHVPANPESTRSGYSFTGWYTDDACSTRVFFKDDASYRNYAKNKVLIEQMPAHNLQIYAGWEAVWYLITIDPNGGELAPGDSLWFWKNYGYTEIQEYTTATRSFEENVNGTYFYALPDRSYYGLTDAWEDREDETVDPEFAALISNRRAIYTTDQSAPGIRDVNKRYVKVQNAYRYAGWYEVKSDGSEELYAFGSPVQHNLHLRLHWKHLGTYRLHYEPGDGEMVERDENEETFKLLDSGVYADSSELLITRTAEPPDGYIFAGWRIRYGDGTVYHPGQSFIFNAAYAVNVPGPDGRPVKQLILDAVYTQVRTVSLTTDANGGTIDPTVATTLPLAYPNAPTLITNITDTTRTVSGMRNNAYGNLSDGKGYVNVLDGTSLTFLGWNTKADGTGTHFDPGQYVGVDTLDAPNGHNVLYAEWGVTVYFDKNNAAADWNAPAWPTNCVWDETKNMFCQTNRLNGCATDPLVPLTSSNDKEMFRYWGIKRYSGEIEPYDFSAPITNASVTLYGVWSNRIEVAVHAVDTTDGARTDMDGVWLTTNVILVTANTYLSFETGSAGYADPGSGYAFMCANLADGHANVSEETMITNLYYNIAEQHVYVTYANGTSAPMPDDKEIYFVYFADPKEMDIAYKVMGMDERLSDVDVSASAPPKAVVTAAGYDVPDEIKQPLASAGNSHKYFAYAIGKPGATDVADLHLITSTSESDGVRPAFRLRNTCHGFQYSTDGGETWLTYGLNAQLYVLYFDHMPVVVTLDEKTLGTAADMETNFTYTVSISQTVVTNLVPSGVQTREGRWTYNWGWKWQWGAWSASSPPREWTTDVIDRLTLKTTATKDVLEQTCSLKNGQQESFTVFSDDKTGGYSIQLPVYPENPDHDEYGDTLYQTNYNVIVTIHQTITITQTPKANFTTTNDGAGGDQKYVYTYMTTGADDETDQRVTFTNTHVVDTIPVHVALGENGAVSNRDDLRTANAGIYTLSITNGVDNTVAFADGAPSGFFTGDAARYRFMGIFYARTNENGVVVSIGTAPVTSVTFAPMGEDGYFGLYFDGDPEKAVGDWELYAVYGEIPSIRYMKEGANGALTEIPTLTYVGNAVKMNGYEVSQGEALDVPVDGTELTIGAGGTANFYVPLSLDGSAQASLNYFALAAGPAGTASTNAMDGVTWGSSIRLKVSGGLLKWSVDGETWGDFTGTAASIYAIYKEKGYDLTVAVDSLASAADRAGDSFTVTLASRNLLVGTDYIVSGYAPGGTPVDYVTATACDEGGMLTFMVTGGVRFTIQSLPNNEWPDSNAPTGMTVKDYTLRELLPSSDYALTNLLVNGAVPLAQVQVENGTATFMDMNKTVKFTNIKRYDVSFVEEDGETEVLSAPYWYGTAADAIATPDAPAKAMDSANLYRFKNWTPALESVQSNTVYTAAYKAIPIPQATQRAANTNIVVTLSEEEAQAREAALVEVLKSVGVDITADDYSETDATEKLNARDPNGLRRWENLVTGTATDQLLLNTVSGNSATISAKMVADPDASVKKDLGYIVLRELRKKGDGDAWRTVAGPFEAGNPSFDIALADGEGNSVNASGLYRLVTLIVPKCDLSITNEIPATNIIGVLEVKSPNVNTIVAVPWKKLASDPFLAADITVSNHVSAVNLTDGDSVYALKDGNTYEMWTLNKGKWESAITVSTASDANYSMVTTATDADKKTFSRGNAVWVTRKNPTDGATAKPFFLVGQYDPAGVTIAVAGGSKTVPACTQIAIPDYTGSVGINDLDWGGNPISTDLITIPNGATTTILRWVNGKWGEYKQVYNETLGRNRNTFVPYTDPIPVGTGFWYSRRGGAFNVTWQPSEIVK